jgi:hypothetical protein
MLVRRVVQCSAVEYGKDLLAGWLRSRLRLQSQLRLRSEAVSVSVRDNVSPCLLSLWVLLCAACFFFGFAWTCVIICRCMTRADIRSTLPSLILATLLWPLYQLCLLISTPQQGTRKAKPDRPGSNSTRNSDYAAIMNSCSNATVEDARWRTRMRRDHGRCHRLEMLNSLKTRAATVGLSKTCESLGRLDPKMGWLGFGVDHRNVQATASSLVQSGGGVCAR